MKGDLAEQLLGTIMGWNGAQLAAHGEGLQALARYKYDAYGMFRPGERFLESLSKCLLQMNDDERRVFVEFVLKQLIFISEPELDHAIELVYRDVIRPLVRKNVAQRTKTPDHAIAQLTNSKEFKAFQRQLLILGMSDGARLDRLRRASPELSHEQFNLVATPAPVDVVKMQEKLGAALKKLEVTSPAVFEHVVLVDDFTGSGFTLLHRNADGTLDGKLIRVRDRLKEAKACMADNFGVSVVLYVGSEKAKASVESLVKEAGLDWRLHIIQTIPASSNVTQPDIEELCKRLYDPALNDEHKGEAPMGFSDSRLPLVLPHNTPNNSISILWGDTSEDPKSTLGRHALFPRYERHSADRP